MTDRLPQLLALREKRPNDPFIAYGIAMEHVKAGRVDDAVTWFDQTLNDDADYCYAYYHKAKAQSDSGQTDAARQTLHTGIERAKAVGDAKAHDEMMELLGNLG